MPVIAAGIVTKLGRILVARCFMDVTRIRIEGLLSAFPKLLGSGSGKQTTFIDSGSVRYLYQPVEGMYLVVVTTKASNIMEDLATLRLLGRVIPEYCQSGITEESVLDKAFEIMFAMDEIVTNGSREASTMEQVVTALEMRSESEERAQREEEVKKKDAQKVAKQRAKELKKRRQEIDFEGPSSGGGGGGYAGPVPHDDAPAASRFSEVATAEPEAKPARKVGGGGMSLSNKRKQDQAARVLAETGGSMPAKPAAATNAVAAAAAADEQELESNAHQVNLRITESISVSLNREGGVNAVEIKGEMSVTIADPAAALVRIQMAPLTNPDFAFKTHPNINKALFTGDHILAMKDSRPYPTNQSPSILKWRAQSLSKPPLSITCWPSESGAVIEFELDNTALTLEHVVLTLPLAGAFPEVAEISQGDYQHDSQASMLMWRIGTISAAEPSGSLEVNLDRESDECFFPASLQFTLAGTLAGVTVRDVCHVETGASVDFGTTARAQTEQYVIE